MKKLEAWIVGRETGLVNLLGSSCEKQYSGLGGDKSTKEAAGSWKELAQPVTGIEGDLMLCHRLARTRKSG